MPSNKKPRKSPSLAAQSRSKKALFLPMGVADADKLALRFRLALTRTLSGSAERRDARCLAETAMMAGLISDLEGGGPSDAGLLVSEECLRRRLAGPDGSAWALSDDEKRSLTAVVNEHDRQLRETRLHSLVMATERFERLLKSVGAVEAIFEARRAENAR